MSRSYKKQPVYKDRNPGSKSLANRRIRRKIKQSGYDNLYNGGFYRKLTCSYDICDYSFRLTVKEFLSEDASADMNWYNKWYKRK